MPHNGPHKLILEVYMFPRQTVTYEIADEKGFTYETGLDLGTAEEKLKNLAFYHPKKCFVLVKAVLTKTEITASRTCNHK